MAFIFHYSLAGGTSGVVFHREFLKILNGGLVPLVRTTIQTPDLDIFPPIENLVRLNIRLAIS
jgi:hypothetical protein